MEQRETPASCLACAKCGQVIALKSALVCDRILATMRDAVFPYELAVLGASTWCYSATQADKQRFDVLCVGDICVGGTRVGGTLYGPRATGVLPLTAEELPSSDHSWFVGFEWQAIRCAGCSIPRLLGWAFTPEAGPKRNSLGFFALIITKLLERAATHNGSRGRGQLVAGVVPGTRVRTQGLSADIVRMTSDPGAAAAARGFGAMPTQLIPSFTTSKGQARARDTVFEELEVASSGSEGGEAVDFQRQRRLRRRPGEQTARRGCATGTYTRSPPASGGMSDAAATRRTHTFRSRQRHLVPLAGLT